MEGLVTAFQEGGAAMYVILALDGALAVCLLVIGMVVLGGRSSSAGSRVARVLAVGGMLGAFLPILAGAGGYALGMTQVRAALAVVAPDQKEALLTRGEQEAAHNLWFGGGSGLVCLVVSGAITALAFAGRPAAPSP